MSTCKTCIHHEDVNDDSFYCEAHNDLFPDEDEFVAEDCKFYHRVATENVDE